MVTNSNQSQMALKKQTWFSAGTHVCLWSRLTAAAAAQDPAQSQTYSLVWLAEGCLSAGQFTAFKTVLNKA